MADWKFTSGGFGTICLTLALLLSACGFRPVYLRADNFAAGGEMAQIEILPIADRRGQMVRNYLLDRMTPGGKPDHAKYVLRVILTEHITNLAVRRDDTATRASLTLNADFVLSQTESEETPFSGRVRSINSHSISVNEVATLAAEVSSRERAARDIADRLTMQIIAYLDAQSLHPDTE